MPERATTQAVRIRRYDEEMGCYRTRIVGWQVTRGGEKVGKLWRTVWDARWYERWLNGN